MKDVAIDRVETAILDVPLRRPHRFARTGMDAQEPADDVARITELAEELAGKASVRVDLDARWDLFTSLRWLPLLAEAGVDLVEQPGPGAEVEWLAEINAALPMPVMADEGLRTPTDPLRLVQLRAPTSARLRPPRPAGCAPPAPTSPSPPASPATAGPRSRARSARSPRCPWSAPCPGVPDGPGLGVELDPAAVAGFRRN